LVHSIILKEVLERTWKYVPDSIKNDYNPQYLIHETFDKLASRCLSKGDLCIAWSGVGLHTIKKARAKGMATIVDEGSSHVLYQQNILREEYEAFGLRPKLAHPKIVEKELQEYDEADYIVIPSQFVKRTFGDSRIPEQRLIHVPYGVDLNEFRPTRKLDDIFRIIYVGNMTLRKGVHYLLKAFTELKLSKAELILVGALDHEFEPFLKMYRGNFTLIPPVPQSVLYKYYSAGTIFILPSVEDGFGMVLLQAMACGLPVICTTNTGGEDVVREGRDGFVIPIRDVEKLKEKILYFYEHPEEREEMGWCARKRVMDGFTWDHYGDRIVTEYTRILKAHAAGSAAQGVSHGTVGIS
jgi:glycosyltransferase involved in cell wall biosynthesis